MAPLEQVDHHSRFEDLFGQLEDFADKALQLECLQSKDTAGRRPRAALHQVPRDCGRVAGQHVRHHEAQDTLWRGPGPGRAARQGPH